MREADELQVEEPRGRERNELRGWNEGRALILMGYPILTSLFGLHVCGLARLIFSIMICRGRGMKSHQQVQPSILLHTKISMPLVEPLAELRRDVHCRRHELPHIGLLAG